MNYFVSAKLTASGDCFGPVYGFYADKDNSREDSPMNQKTIT